ncbi:MAG: lamin tail domain-containing protein [Planctomycetes bacterium]|nr:lamin tail domain-containing protein [Planctomycetota bacterium]
MSLSSLWLGALFLCSDPESFQVVLNEIHYHPAGGGDEEEFVELYHAGTRPVDLSGWQFVEGIQFVFPPRTILYPGSALAIAADAAALRPRSSHPEAVIGDYAGRLGNGGDHLRLITADRVTVLEMTFTDDNPWPQEADGLGPSMELRSALDDYDLPGSWTASRRLGGTPGEVNSTALLLRRAYLISRGAVWSYFKGTQEPAAGTAQWTQAAYDDSGWASGASAFGTGGAGPFGTPLDDLPGGYTSIYFRKTFSLPAASLPQDRLRLEITYQDGFVAYVNGLELARRGVGGKAGEAIPYGAAALADFPNAASEVISFAGAGMAGSLAPEGNVLAVQALNGSPGDAQFAFSAELFLIEEEAAVPPPPPVPARLSEVKGGPEGWVELANDSSEPFDLEGLTIEARPGYGRRHRFDAPALIPARGFYVLEGGGFQALGIPPAMDPAAGETLVLHRDGLWLDALEYRLPDAAFSFGRSSRAPSAPSGGEGVCVQPTPGAANQVSRQGQIVLNEIHYHPQPESGRPAPVEFVEIHNTSAEPVDLTGWRFTRGLSFSFAAGTTLAGGGYLVIAPDPAAVQARYGVNGVLGGFAGGLKNSAETIQLADPLGNAADRVRYADDGAWPAEADGQGKTLELRHPALDNRLGLSWAASPGAGTPGSRNGAFQSAPPPALGEAAHEPLLPASPDAVLVTVRASAVPQDPLSMTLRHRREGQGGFASAPMFDDGLHGDGDPADGVFAGIIPPQPDQSVVQFYFEALDGGGRTAALPRNAPQESYLFFVDDSPPPETLPRFRLVMTRADRQNLETRSPSSNVELPATVIYKGRAHYRSGVRYRGRSSRTYSVKSYKVALNDENPLEGVADLALNGRNIYHQRIGMDLFRRAGLPYSRNQLVHLALNGDDLGLRIRMERVDERYLEYHFPGREGGNLYRGDLQATLNYVGNNPDSYRPYYLKENNQDLDDYSDIIQLCNVFTNASGAEFPAAIDPLIDVPEWLRFLALHNVVSNLEGGIYRDTGDDYFIYRRSGGGVEPDRWVMIPWDFDDIFGDVQERVPRVTVPSTLRLVQNASTGGPRYFCQVRSLAEDEFSPPVTNARINTLAGLFPEDTLNAQKNFVINRQAYLLGAARSRLTAEFRGGALLPKGGSWKFKKGTEALPGGENGWTSLDFDDSSWNSGLAGFGYAAGENATVLSDMQGSYSTVYLRRRFTVADPQALASLNLLVDYDDGFVAFLNGVEVARALYNGPADPVPFNALASDFRDPGAPLAVDLRPYLSSLRAGENILAVVGINYVIDSRDFTINPWLDPGSGNSFGCGGLLFTTASLGELGGSLPLCQAAAVAVNGDLALFGAGSWSCPVTLSAPESLFHVEALGFEGEIIDQLDVRVILGTGVQAVSQNISASATWPGDGSLYVVPGSISVAAGAVLTIAAGATVLLGPGVTLRVEGRLAVEGTPERPVRFSSASCSGEWGGIAFVNSSEGSRLAGARFERCAGAMNGQTALPGSLAAVNSSLEVAGCSFIGLSQRALSIQGGSALVEDCLFERLPGAIRVENAKATVRRNQAREVEGLADAIQVIGGAAGDGAIEDNRIERTNRHGIALDGSAFPVAGNWVSGALGRGLSLSGGAAPRLERNLIYFCDIAVGSDSAADLVLAHHTLAFNSIALAPAGAWQVLDSIIWENSKLISESAPGAASFAYSDIGPENLPPGAGNLSGDPLFKDPLQADFSLMRGSPAIGRAQDGGDMGAFSFDRSGFLRGDADLNGGVEIADAVQILLWLFQGGSLGCLAPADANSDGAIDLSDAVRLLIRLFLGGQAEIAPPYPECGPDPAPGLFPPCETGCP